MYDPRTDPVGPPNGRWFRIPLPGDPFGVMLLLPDRQFTPEEWAQIHAVLEAFRPGLVDYPPPDRGDDFVADPRAETNEALAEMGAGAADMEAERLTFVPATPENILAAIAENEARIDAVLGRRPQSAVSPGDPDWVDGFGPVPGSGLE